MAELARLSLRCGACAATSRVEFSRVAAGKAVCAACGEALRTAGTVARPDALAACAACGSSDLYIRKAFPRAAGIGVVVAAAALTLAFSHFELVPPWAIYAPLFAAAAIDALLYFTTGDAVGCYRCSAIHYHCTASVPLDPYDLERAEEMRLGWKPGARAKR
jgi:hypothetical protein